MSNRNGENNYSLPISPNMAPVPSSALPNYVKSHKTQEIIEILQQIRRKVDQFAENKVDDTTGIKLQEDFLTRLAVRRKRLLSEIRCLIGNLQVIWTEQTAGYKGSHKNVIKAANILIQRINVVVGTVDVTKQTSVKYSYRYLNQVLPRMQSTIIITAGDHLDKTETLNYDLEKIKVSGLSAMAGRAGIQSQSTGFRSRITNRLRRKKKD